MPSFVSLEIFLTSRFHPSGKSIMLTCQSVHSRPPDVEGFSKPCPQILRAELN